MTTSWDNLTENRYSRTLRTPGDDPLQSETVPQLQTNIDDGTGSLKIFFRKLKCVIDKEMRTYWDKHALTEYVSTNMIPRGLRIKTYLPLMTL